MTLRFERSYGDRLRVRTWRHDAARVAWPAGAHAAFELAVVRTGAIRYRIGRRQLEVGPGQAMIVPQEVEHATTIDRGTQAVSLWIGAQLVVDAAETLAQPAERDPLVIEDAARLDTLVGLMSEEARAQDRGADLMLGALTDAVLVEALRRAPPAPGRPRVRDARILAAVARIEREFASPLTVEALADASRMSRFHFSRLFLKEVGASPYRYLLRTRLSRAAELLRTGRCVTDAALSVGIHDLGRFAQMMRRELGVSPQELRGRRDLARLEIGAG